MLYSPSCLWSYLRGCAREPTKTHNSTVNFIGVQPEQMVVTYVRKTKRQSWEEQAMQRAIDVVNNGEMGWLRASKLFGAPQTTLRRRARNKNKTGHRHIKECSVSRARSVAQHKPKAFASMTNNKQRTVEHHVLLPVQGLCLSTNYANGLGMGKVEYKGSEPSFSWRESRKPFRKSHPSSPIEIRASISPSSAINLAQHETSALANYANETMKV
uniref:HTH psq-type domain-containing protein n=1 Tax=Timema genevievae TaxID=629358 RepID=A0A7R9JWX6_TIMGE|nr:unnamed protein product [Timema genevievae]